MTDSKAMLLARARLALRPGARGLRWRRPCDGLQSGHGRPHAIVKIHHGSPLGYGLHNNMKP